MPTVGGRVNGLIGESPEIRAVNVLIERIARTTSHVLITGEPGTGKGQVARAIHAASARRDRPFVTVDCHTVAEALARSHRREIIGRLGVLP